MSEAYLHNPYTPLHPEETVELGNFVGRREIWFDDLRHRLHRERGYGRHLIIQGPSGIGKTSLLLRIRRQAIDGEKLPSEQVVYRDLGAPDVSPLEVVQAIHDALPLKAAAEGKERAPGFLRRLGDATKLSVPFVGGIELDVAKLLNDRRPQTLDAAFGLVYEALDDQQPDQAVVVILDQIGVVAERARDGDEGWRHFLGRLDRLLHVTQRDSCRVLFILGVRMERMGALTQVAGQILTSGAIHLRPLDDLSEKEAAVLVTVPAERVRVRYDPETVRLLVQLAGRSPFDLQLACFFLWEWLDKEGRLATVKPLAMSKDELNEAVRGGLRERFWEPLSDDEQEVLKLVAQYQGQLSGRELAEMAQEKGLEDAGRVAEGLCTHSFQPLRNLKGKYLIAHDLLRECVLSQVPEEDMELVFWQRVLEDAPQRHGEGGSLFTARELGRLWLLRERLRPTTEQLHVILLSEVARYIATCEEQAVGDALCRWAGGFSEQGVAALTRVAQSDGDGWVRLRAALALAFCGEAEAAAPFLKEGSHWAEGDWELLEVAQALADSGEGHEAVPILAQLVHSAKDDWVRREAADALQWLDPLGEDAG